MRRTVLISASLVIAGGTAAAVFVSTRETGTPDERRARQACAHIGTFTRIVERDGSSTDAIRELGLAKVSASEAARLDVRWVALESGVQTLQLAVNKDDADAAQQGLLVVQERCRVVG